MDLKEAFENLFEALPDWAKDRRLVLLSGIELVAAKDYGHDWKIKKVRCNQCGECCLDMEPDYLPFGVSKEGICNMLEQAGDKMLCKAGHVRPLCCLADPEKENAFHCCIEYF